MVPAAATSLFVSSSSADLSLAMAQRLGDDLFLSVRVARPLTTRPCTRRFHFLPGMRDSRTPCSTTVQEANILVRGRSALVHDDGGWTSVDPSGGKGCS